MAAPHQGAKDNQRELKLTGANWMGPLELDAFSRPFPASSTGFGTEAAAAAGSTCSRPVLARAMLLSSE